MSMASSANSQPRPATDKQRSFLTSLVRDRDVASIGESREVLLDAIADMDSREASSWIDALLKLDKVQTTPTDPQVQSGRYALINADGAASFYVVERITDGKWAGRTFVTMMVGDNGAPVKDRTQRTAILERIAADELGALARYGQMIGVCGACGLTLTDEVSRARGIGPVCAKNRS